MRYAVVFIEWQPLVIEITTMTVNAETCDTVARTNFGFVGHDILGDIEANFRRNLPILMNQRGYTNASLAKALGINRSAITMWLNGRQMASWGIINQIATLFRLPDPSLLLSNDLETRVHIFATEDEAVEFLHRKKQERRAKQESIEPKDGDSET